MIQSLRLPFSRIQEDAFRREFSSSKTVIHFSDVFRDIPDARKEDQRTIKFDTSDLPDCPKQVEETPKGN